MHVKRKITLVLLTSPLPSPRLCSSTAGCSLPSMPCIVFCLFLSCTRLFPPSMQCHLAIFFLVVPLISSPPLVAINTPIVLHSCYMSGPFPFFPVGILYCQLFLLFSWSLSMVLYLVALNVTVSSLLLFELFFICQLFIKRPCFAGCLKKDILAYARVYESVAF